jgi:predicted RNA-binding protein with RPS1 domain
MPYFDGTNIDAEDAFCGIGTTTQAGVTCYYPEECDGTCLNPPCTNDCLAGDDYNQYCKCCDAKKIALGYRKPEDNPWLNVGVEVGDVVEAKVVSMKPFGAFVELPNGLEGLVHISNITHTRIAKPQDVLEMGQMVNAKVVEIDLDKKRIELSIRELEGAAVEAEATTEAIEGEQITLDSVTE